jgi:DNA primase
VPKYLNSPQTAIFDKGRLLFGLDMARRSARESHDIVIVEGYLDVIQAWQNGFQNVVAQMGTSLTEAQLRLAKRYARRFILALDADAAGAQATLRSLEVARQALDRTEEPGFDARGLVRNQGRLQADIRVASLPEGYDPDKLIRSDPAAWTALIEAARPVVAYVIEVATHGLDLDDAPAKAEVARKLMPLISEVADPVEREHYRQLLARTLRIDERVLYQGSPNAGRSRPRPADRAGNAQGQPQPGAGKAMAAAMQGKSGDLEKRRADFLRQCLAFPQIIARVDRRLELSEQPPVEELDFRAPEDRALWRFLRQQAPRWAVVAPADLWDSLPDDFLRDRVRTLLALPASPESELADLPDDLVLSVLEWRFDHVRALTEELWRLYGESRRQGDAELMAMVGEQLREMKRRSLGISKAKRSLSAANRRGIH